MSDSLMRSSATTAVINAAVVALQADLTTFKNTAKAGIGGGGQAGFMTYDAIWEQVQGLLTSNGIAVYQGGAFVGGGGDRVVTRLAKGDEWIESDYPVKAVRDGGQGIGAAISFAKRWGLCSMLGIRTSNDGEERQGYKDNRPPKASSKPKAPAALASMLEAIRAAEVCDELAARAGAARAANPTGEAATAVEREISAWFVASLTDAKTLDRLTEIRDVGRKVRARGSEVAAALASAGKRLEGPPS